MKKEDFVKNHTHINYCEAIIYPDGEIEYARPSHIYHLMKISGHSRDELYEMMGPFEHPLEYMLNLTSCMCVWYDFYKKPPNPSKEQEEALAYLIKNKVMRIETKDDDGYFLSKGEI